MTESKLPDTELTVGMKVAYKENPYKLIGHIRQFEQFPSGPHAHVLAPGYSYTASVMDCDWLVPWIEAPKKTGADEPLESSCL